MPFAPKPTMKAEMTEMNARAITVSGVYALEMLTV